MAANFKQGLDYFPLNVDTEMDDKWKLIEAEFGDIGFAVMVKLFQKIYKEGYYYLWTDKEQLLFSYQVSTELSDICKIVDKGLQWEMFNNHLFEQFKILSSRGIQRRYFEAVKRRKNVDVIEEYLLVNMNDYVSSDNVSINSINADINKQRRREKSTKESTVQDTSVCYPETSLRIAQLLNSRICEWDPEHKYNNRSPSLKSWQKDIDAALRIDGRTEEQLVKLIDAIYLGNTQQANFWKPNVQSGKKLREKFDVINGQLKIQSTNGYSKKSKNRNQYAGDFIS